MSKHYYKDTGDEEFPQKESKGLYPDYVRLAREFWDTAKVGQSILIKGNDQGQHVIDVLNQCDKEENMIDDGKGLRRKRQRPKNAIGGYLAQKLFRWSSEVRPVDGKGLKHYTIWRIQ
jgi:hypothetical protein